MGKYKTRFNRSRMRFIVIALVFLILGLSSHSFSRKLTSMRDASVRHVNLKALNNDEYEWSINEEAAVVSTECVDNDINCRHYAHNLCWNDAVKKNCQLSCGLCQI